MNEQIRLLYDQSIVIEDGGDYVYGELDPEKFAELIVRECAKIADDPDVDMLRVGKVIKEHFGVEE